jgi:DNA mismatch repair protein MutL
LPAQLANQIAAGEVVERPSSVVKELVENSLDAGATSIEVDIEKGGHKRIRIRDNGAGIVRSELELALAPHSTSKIETLDDLENIASLGFRGEALASISSVSRLTLTSKPAAQSEAWSASAQGRDMAVDIQPAAHPDGTTIDVCDLFFNTPARRKFLRAEKTEFQHIEDVIRRVALSRPRVTFLLKHNQKVIKRWTASQTNAEQKRIGQVCGKQFAEQSAPVSIEYEGVTLRAWVGDQSLMRSASDLQFSFVNGRAMRDKLLLHAIRQAYESVYEIVEQPAYVVFLDLNPSDVDVNVHPAKHEVRFQHARQVHDLVCRAFQDGLAEKRDLQCDSESQSFASNDYLRQEAPSHDYIRPLTTNTGATTTSSFTGGGSRTTSFTREPAPSRVASAAYTELMTSTQTNYLHVGSKGVMQIKGDSLIWISVESILPLWLDDMIANATVSQPLLMPVAIASNEDVNACLEVLSKQKFVVQVAHGKCLLKQVPATLRQLPWGKLFPAFFDGFIQHNYQDWDIAATLLARLIVNFDKDAKQAMDWFTCLPSERQTELADKLKKTVPANDLAGWLNQ